MRNLEIYKIHMFIAKISFTFVLIEPKYFHFSPDGQHPYSSAAISSSSTYEPISSFLSASL